MKKLFIDHLEKVKEFQVAFGLTVNEIPVAAVEENLFLLRHRLMEEENEEYLDACYRKDITEIADALGDKLYILLGTIITHGLQDVIEKVFEEIHSSNMSKLDEKGLPVYRDDGKILKSNNYFKPDLKKIVEPIPAEI